MRKWLAAMSMVLCAAPLWAGTPPETPVERAMRRGSMMFWYDRAAWVTTDDLEVKLPRDRREDIGGWVVTPKGMGYHVDYVGRGAAADHVVYAADVNGPTVSNAIAYPAATAPTLTGDALRMLNALAAARAEMARHGDWGICAQAMFNTVVLPPENGVIPVYFLTPQTQTGIFPFGGHYEVDIAADGRIASARKFTNSCLDMRNGTDDNGKEIAMIGVSHLLDPQPTEIHVFQQLSAGTPVAVITGPDRIWSIENGRIERVSNLGGK